MICELLTLWFCNVEPVKLEMLNRAAAHFQISVNEQVLQREIFHGWTISNKIGNKKVSCGKTTCYLETKGSDVVGVIGWSEYSDNNSVNIAW